MFRFVLSVFICMLPSFSILAQIHPDSLVYKNVTWEMLEGRFYHLDVNGVEIGDTLSQKQFVDLFGKPDQLFNQDESQDGVLYMRNPKSGVRLL